MAVSIGKYHLFQRRLISGSFWYYWYEDEGKRIQKACGYGCESKREAVAFLEELFKQDLLEEKRKTELRRKTLSDFTEKMFLENSPHLARLRAKGRTMKPQTIHQHRRHLVNYLIPKFGNSPWTKSARRQWRTFCWNSGCPTPAGIPSCIR